MIILTEENKKYIKESELKGNIKIDGVEYFYKVYNDGMKYSEIIAEKLMHLLGIKCAHYDTSIIDDELYYFSKSLGTDGLFLCANCMPLYGNTLYELWINIEKYYGDAKVAMEDIIKIYLFDILFMNSDRDSRNYGILHNNDGSIAIYAFDNETIFDIDNRVSLTARYDNSEKLKKHNTCENNLEELELFLNVSTIEMQELLERMLKIVTPETVINVLNDVEKEVNDSIDEKDMYINMYKKNYEAIKALLESRGKDGKRIH